MTMKQAILAFLLGLTLMPGLRGTGWAAGSETWGAIFQSQLERCWEKPHDLHLGGLAVDELEATFTIKFKRDGTLEGPPIWAESATPYVAAYQMRVRDAVIKCQPYNLPAAYFNEWKHFELTFSERNPNSTRLPSNTPMQSLVDWIGTSMMSIPDVK
jgi:hypothetical protein